jgi:hypothetical protein
LTLRFDAGRFRPTPAACYQASWQLPGPDSHRQTTTNLSLDRDNYMLDLQQSGRTPLAVELRGGDPVISERLRA